VKFFYSNAEKSFEVEVHMPRKDDTHFNEFAFKNSLEATIDKEKIENLYEKGSIGFLATEENLEDEEFMSLIIELKKELKDTKILAIYLKKDIAKVIKKLDHFVPREISNITDICHSIDIYITNDNITNSLDNKINNFIYLNSETIFAYTPYLRSKKLNLYQWEKNIGLFHQQDFKNYAKSYGLSITKNNAIVDFYNQVFDRFAESTVWLNNSISPFELYKKIHTEYGIKNRELQIFLIKFYKGWAFYNEKSKSF
jgi:hypothetical protein